MDSITTTSVLLAYFFFLCVKFEAVVRCINQIHQSFLEQIILEMWIVSQLLVDMASTSKCSSNANTESILNILWHVTTPVWRCLQVILTPTCRVSGYPRQVIKLAMLLRQLRFICTALPTVMTLITVIPLSTYNTSSWYIFLWDDATPLVHLSSLMTAVFLSLSFYWPLILLLYWLWTSCFHITTTLVPILTVDLTLTALLL
jgi:hypothetical protein